MMRRVHGAGSEIEKERLIRCDLLGIGDEGDSLVDEVFCEVIAFLGSLLRLDLMVVVDELGVILVGVTAQEAVEALEASAQRPAVIGPCRRRLMRRGQVPFADSVGVVALLQEDFREKTVLKGNHPIAAGKTGGAFGDAGQAIRVMVASGEQARAGGGAEGRRVKVGVAQPAGRKRVEMRRADRRTVTAKLTEAGVVQHDEQYIRRAILSLERSRPGWRGLIRCAPDDAGEGCARCVLDKGHSVPILINSLVENVGQAVTANSA